MKDNWYEATVTTEQPYRIVSVADWVSDAPPMAAPVPKKPTAGELAAATDHSSVAATGHSAVAAVSQSPGLLLEFLPDDWLKRPPILLLFPRRKDRVQVP